MGKTGPADKQAQVPQHPQGVPTLEHRRLGPAPPQNPVTQLPQSMPRAGMELPSKGCSCVKLQGWAYRGRGTLRTGALGSLPFPSRPQACCSQQ